MTVSAHPNPQRDEAGSLPENKMPPPISVEELQRMQDHWKEFRRFRRKPVILAAKLETARGVFDCVALDLSLGGARLRIAAAIEVHERVTLALTKYGRFASKIAWRNEEEAGLQFSDLPEEVARRFGTAIPFA